MIRVLKPKLKKMQPRLRSTREVRDRRYSADATVRKWYKSARWLRLREKILIRDHYQCQRTGVPLTGKAPAPNSPVIHHKTPHKGDERLFWDEGNLEAVSKEWHDGEGQKAERGLDR